MGRDRWQWIVCCAALACSPFQEGAFGDDDGDSTSAGETGASAMPTTTSTTASSADAESGSTDPTPPSTTSDPADTSDTSDTSDTNDVGSTTLVETTGASEETGEPADVHDGEYAGTISSTITVAGLGMFPCNGTATFVVNEAAVPQVVGTGSCFVSIPVLGEVAEVTATADGALADATAMGMLTYGIELAGISETTTWSGSFAGDTFDGTFSGATQLNGVVATFVGSWTTTR